LSNLVRVQGKRNTNLGITVAVKCLVQQKHWRSGVKYTGRGTKHQPAVAKHIKACAKARLPLGWVIRNRCSLGQQRVRLNRLRVPNPFPTKSSGNKQSLVWAPGILEKPSHLRGGNYKLT